MRAFVLFLNNKSKKPNQPPKTLGHFNKSPQKNSSTSQNSPSPISPTKNNQSSTIDAQCEPSSSSSITNQKNQTNPQKPSAISTNPHKKILPLPKTLHLQSPQRKIINLQRSMLNASLRPLPQ